MQGGFKIVFSLHAATTTAYHCTIHSVSFLPNFNLQEPKEMLSRKCEEKNVIFKFHHLKNQ